VQAARPPLHKDGALTPFHVFYGAHRKQPATSNQQRHCADRVILAKMSPAMSDDFGTVNLKRGDKTREMEVLRKHRESLVKMLADVDQEIRELELAHTQPVFTPPPATPTHPALRGNEPVESRPLVNTATHDYDDSVTTPGSGAPRVLLILGAAVLALAIIGWLIWRASSDRPAAAGTVVEETATAETTAAESTAGDTAATVEETDTIAPASRALVMTPRSHDYGLVRKGTRATRQFEIANTTEEPLSVTLARSTCRCLYYEHAGVIPPKAKESITVTVDGAKAKAGVLRESIQVTGKTNPGVSTSFDVIATVR
jgi:hypothetical protein